MDFLSLLPTILLALGLVLIIYNIWRLKNSSDDETNKKVQEAPEIAGGLPLIGHLHILFRAKGTPLARTFSSFDDKYGPIFQIRLGSCPAIVVSNKDAIKECFTTNDLALASRPKSSPEIHLHYSFAVGFAAAPYGPYWTKMRKLVMVELLSPRRIDSLRHVFESEIDHFIHDLMSYLGGASKVKVVMSEWLERLSFNIITRMIAGKSFNYLKNVDDKEANRILKLIREFTHIVGEFVPSDLIPIIGWFPIEGQVLKNRKRIGKDMDKLVGSWVEEHQHMKIEFDNNNETSEKQDLIDVMLSVIEDDPSSGLTRDNIIKANVTNLIIGGSDTTAISMTWILTMLLSNKHVLKRAQEEIDLHVSKNRKVEASDVKNLVYLQAILKETLRLYPPAPLSIPHEAREDFYIHGYYVPKGTRVFANVWKLHRDPSIWSEPEKFSPERFINGNGELNEDHHLEYLPFGLGRRACPGYTFATQVILMSLARFLQSFDLDTAMDDEPVDIREGFGLTLPKLTPLTILLTPRANASI
ncbi:hypothetical protein PIB30_048587 [Stylosanthes scabra]|uniref:Cytochrome P450 n=1 Tax=Stylosanthes scabra TaxID=79078 RepID=A0ABU6YFY1_9FABA|nr:hypothetical protein [Stylosanthes scabra]